jgi:hypothetical protein
LHHLTPLNDVTSSLHDENAFLVHRARSRIENHHHHLFNYQNHLIYKFHMFESLITGQERLLEEPHSLNETGGFTSVPAKI